jgi:hypothetical protein
VWVCVFEVGLLGTNIEGFWILNLCVAPPGIFWTHDQFWIRCFHSIPHQGNSSVH